MADCGNCGEKLNEGDKFCGTCGTPVPQQPNDEKQAAQSVEERSPSPKNPAEPPETGTAPKAGQGSSRRIVVAGVAVVLALGVASVFFTNRTDEQDIRSSAAGNSAMPTRQPASDAAAVVSAPPIKAAQDTVPDGWVAVETTFGRIDDRSSTASLCPREGPCRRAHNQTLLFGDRVEAPQLVTIDFDEADGDISRHGLKGNISNIEMFKTPSGPIVSIRLDQGRMAGDVRGLQHVLHFGGGLCAMSQASYVAERNGQRGRFMIEKGLASCQSDGNEVRLSPANPTLNW